MSIQQMLLGASGASGYLMDKSLRFRSSASANMVRTPASAGDQQKFTYSGLIKRGNISSGSTRNTLISTNEASAPWALINFETDNTIQVSFTAGLSSGTYTSAVFRDPSAWYHIVVAVDTTQATAANRIKIYVNGVLQAIGTANYPAQNTNTQFNSTVIHRVGGYAGAFFDGYMADVYWIDGQALTPASFGSTNALTGVWQPKAYTGTYGTNGFYLDFEDTSSVAALGTDSSGNGNTWTVNNISLTTGVTYDSMTDVLTLTSATAANFAVLNPLDNAASLSNANLTWTSTGNQGTRASFFVSSAKWYWEITSTVANQIAEHGVAQASQVITGTTAYPGAQTISWGFSNNSGSKSNNNVFTNIASGGTTNDVIMVALDCDNGKIWWGRNGTWFSSGDPSTGANAAFTNISGSVAPMTGVGGAGAGTFAYNFGQRPFAYTPPTGFVALNTFNLPTSTILKGSNEMDIALDTGANIKATTEAEFTGSQIFEWIKDRANANNHQLLDSVRGLTAVLQSNTTAAETTYTAPSGNSVGWVWKAGASAVSNTDGSITSTVSVNAAAGFSVVTYTGTGANATVGHGLGVASKMVIVKSRSNANDWFVGSDALTSWANIVKLNTGDAQSSVSTIFNSTAPTSSVFSLGSASQVNGSGVTYVAYCFAPIEGYSAIGKYTGNQVADGPFIYTGFKPKFVLIKDLSNSSQNWFMFDSARNTYNVVNARLFANLSNAESTNNDIDFLSNGFKLRAATGGINFIATMMYMAFAENPFRNSLAR